MEWERDLPVKDFQYGNSSYIGKHADGYLYIYKDGESLEYTGIVISEQGNVQTKPVLFPLDPEYASACGDCFFLAGGGVVPDFATTAAVMYGKELTPLFSVNDIYPQGSVCVAPQGEGNPLYVLAYTKSENETITLLAMSGTGEKVWRTPISHEKRLVLRGIVEHGNSIVVCASEYEGKALLVLFSKAGEYLKKIYFDDTLGAEKKFEPLMSNSIISLNGNMLLVVGKVGTGDSVYLCFVDTNTGVARLDKSSSEFTGSFVYRMIALPAGELALLLKSRLVLCGNALNPTPDFSYAFDNETTVTDVAASSTGGFIVIGARNGKDTIFHPWIGKVARSELMPATQK